MKKRMAQKIFNIRVVRVSAYGFMLVLSTFVGLYLGIYLDQLTNMAPNFTLAGLILGIIIGFKGFLEETLRQRKEGKG